MISPATWPRERSSYFAAFLATAVISTFVLINGITCNQALAISLTLVVLTLWQRDKLRGTLAATMFFLTKAFFVRIAFAVDSAVTEATRFDLLSITPALVLLVLILWQLYIDIVADRLVLTRSTRVLLTIFAAFAVLSVMNPMNSWFNGLAGFERVVLPNMMILFLFASVVRDERDVGLIVRSLLVLGAISCSYSIGQFALGAYPWETEWLREVAFRDSTQGLTIGLRGIELRVFSVFYGYMDFFFTNVIIFTLVLSCGSAWNRPWQRLRIIYCVLWFAILGLTLERMPLLMSLVAATTMYWIRSDRRRRRRILISAAGAMLLLIVCLSAVGPILRDTEIAKFVRLAEMANPLSATSLADRAERNWMPTLEIIRSHPLGVGVGFGSQTVATETVRQSGLWMGPHNELLQKALETGIPGALVYLLLLISVYRDGLRGLRLSKNVARFSGGMLAVSLAFWICGLVNLPFVGGGGLTYWALAGALVAVTPSTCRECRTPQTAQNSSRIQSGELV